MLMAKKLQSLIMNCIDFSRKWFDNFFCSRDWHPATGHFYLPVVPV